jgi:hypothetical protein
MAAVEHVGVDLSGSHVAVAEEPSSLRMSWPRSRRWMAKLCLRVWAEARW